MYCMPQKGTKTALYIGNGDEAQGIATGCIRTNGSTCEGTTIESNGGLVLMAKEGIRLESMTGIAMQGMSDIMALHSEGASSLCVNGSVDMLGRLAGISASKYTGYPPYDDAPKEGEFDWDGFTRNLAIGLGVVAVCAIGAAISIATLGAGSILAGAFIGAGIGALSTTAMKEGEEISTGNVRSAGERLAYAVFDDSMSWDEKWAYAFEPGQMVADFVTGVVIGEILDGIMAAIQNKLRSIFVNYDATMREALESGSNSYSGEEWCRYFRETYGNNNVTWENATPSQLARSWQGSGKYIGIDEYTDVTVNKGTILYRGEPNGTEYFTTLDAIEQSGRNATTIFEGLQVEKNPIHGYRGEMQGYLFNEDVASAYGITNANPQFGNGGLPQYYVPDVQDLISKGILIPVDNIKLYK